MEKRENLYHPMPFEDLTKIYHDFSDSYPLEDLSVDLHTYWMNIAGSLSYVANNRQDQLSQRQVSLLTSDFFEQFPTYEFLKRVMRDYPHFLDEYMLYDEVRVLLLTYLVE
ncbi:YxiJ family protein [Cytobacillus sp. FSL K6-0129]|uniref:YxiJ family protein n=1 Tax=Cytobacillus sp. FSL K6-0129 TaxID=2921421 RepID=UPI0030F4D8B9